MANSKVSTHFMELVMYYMEIHGVVMEWIIGLMLKEDMFYGLIGVHGYGCLDTCQTLEFQTLLFTV